MTEPNAGGTPAPPGRSAGTAVEDATSEDGRADDATSEAGRAEGVTADDGTAEAARAHRQGDGHPGTPPPAAAPVTSPSATSPPVPSPSVPSPAAPIASAPIASASSSSARTPAGSAGPDAQTPAPPPAPADRVADKVGNATVALPTVSARQPDPPSPVRTPAPNALDQYAALAAADRASATAPKPSPPSPQPARPAAAGAGDSGPRGRSGRRFPERAPRRARLQLRHLNVWSVLKFSCVLAVALFLVWLIMIAVLYGILDQMQVLSRVNDTVRTINGNDQGKDVVTSNIILYGALIIGMVNMVLFIVLSTIGSLVYNLCADLVGGIEVTLAERD